MKTKSQLDVKNYVLVGKSSRIIKFSKLSINIFLKNKVLEIYDVCMLIMLYLCQNLGFICFSTLFFFCFLLLLFSFYYAENIKCNKTKISCLRIILFKLSN